MKALKIMSFLIMVTFIMTLTTASALAAQMGTAKTELQEGSYTIPVAMKKGTNINEASMAASCVKGGTIKINADDTATVTIDLQKVVIGPISSGASNWKIYQGSSASGETVEAAESLDSESTVNKIEFALPDNSFDGVYVNMTITVAGTVMVQDAYFALDYSNAVRIPEFGSANVLLSAGTYNVPVAMKNATNIASDSMAKSCIKSPYGKMVVKADGTATMSIETQAVSLGVITDWAEQWKIYQGDPTKSEKVDATENINDENHINRIAFDVPDITTDGVYASMYVPFMKQSPNAYLAFDYANAERVYNNNITLSVPIPTKGEYIHKVAVEVNGTDYELFNYMENSESYDFVARLYGKSDKAVNVTGYYIYNYTEGDFDGELSTAVDSEMDDGSSKTQLYKRVIYNAETKLS